MDITEFQLDQNVVQAHKDAMIKFLTTQNNFDWKNSTLSEFINTIYMQRLNEYLTDFNIKFDDIEKEFIEVFEELAKEIE